ncbi:aldehyde dehydrogenase [Plasticicumulans acidivorans]|uniref:Gamma-glutamyl-gamma-aminobutyraldehyde dehydrogenase n=1 Tax=Plasticicumulans acidivorans TaxID=886464 RepID=A0A317MQW2_9GAMM|nr:aldehyde dehydrogenase [Plasticicumulans acidivorans]PWV58852.1 gamma-glutamyl-gamma-aminobutyraldehyde dehydrogenase [Plasticicumulans acidivorans]
MFKTQPDWHARAATVALPRHLLIDGRALPAASGETFDCISPIDGRLLTQIPAGDAADVDLAVAAARRAFDDGRWSAQPPAARKRTLLAFAELIAAHTDELALLETLDMGKPIADSLAVDVRATVDTFRWYAEAIDKVYDEIAPTAADSLALVCREPLGVVAAVVPWNFPMMMAAWKLAPALAAGNSVVLKPAEQSPLTAIRLGELALEAGLPPGVFNVVTGFGPSAGRALGMHADVDGVFFTGSTEVGKLFLQYSGQSNMKRVGLECGGKSPHIVLADCGDPETAAAAVAGGIFFNQGEMCTAGSRLIVHRSLHDRVLDGILAAAAEVQPGDPLDPATRLGALVDESHTRRVLDYIDIGRAEGARLACGGERLAGRGCYVQPTVFDGVDNRMRIAQEEIFGPVLSVISVDSAAEALAVANDTCYGLAAALWSDNIDTVHRMARGLRAGVVYVNCYDADDLTVPFGGYKQSGIGRDKSLHALDKYTELKSTWIRLR